ATDRGSELREGLAPENPAFLNDLAGSLNNLGNRYSDVGRRADAVAPAERAVEICEELAAENPAFLNNLAGSLNNLGISYGEVGRRADSVAPTERAVGIYEELAAENPAFIPSLASSLGNLGNRYSDVGRRADAVAPTERAVGIYEGLAAENPVFLPDLARSLNNLATGYSETGDRMRGARRWDAVIERFHDDAHAGAVLRLRRARGADEFDEAIHDLIDADALAASLGRNWIVELHNTCRAYRERDPERVDALWETARGGVPDWLTLDDTTFSACADWLNTDTWAASRDYLVAHYQSILGHFGHTALAELALRYPDNPTIVDHQKLLETCGTDGIDAAYRPLLVGETVRTWRSLADPGEAKQYLLDNSDEILSKEGHEALANDLVGQAIITLARGSEIDLAYDLLTATDQTRTAMIADARRHAEALKLHSVATLCAAGTEDEQTLALAMTHLAIAAALNGQVEFSVELLREVRAARPAPDLISEITDAIAHRPADAAALAPLVAAISAP
ncbi:MAG: tetratricopeptide repeat protein, partial [Solirubrobacteraceae bacterium]